MRKIILFIFCVIGASGIMYAQTPTASLLDVKFKNEGVAVDASSQQMPVAKKGTIPTTYDNEIKQYVSQFTRDNTSFYKIDFYKNAFFVNALDNKPFTIEVYTKTKGPEEMSSIGAMESGGLGIEQVSGGGATRLWMGASAGGYKQVGNISTYNPSKTQYYHIVYTYDGDILRSYFNGALTHTVTIGGGVRWNTSYPVEQTQWLAIGGDAFRDGASTQGPFNGDIAIVRMYDKEVNATEVTSLFQQIENRKALTKADLLNELINNTLPGYKEIVTKPQNKALIDQMIEEGWGLMHSMTTTDADIQAFNDRIDSYEFQYGDNLLRSIKINGENWYPNKPYLIKCDFTGTTVDLELDPKDNVAINMSNKQIIDVSKPGITTIMVTATPQTGDPETYQILIEKLFSFNDIVLQRRNKLFIVNNNPETNGGYTFAAYQWFKNGNKIGTEQYYSAGRDVSQVLDVEAEYSVELTTKNGQILHTCPGYPSFFDIMMKSYPNPVSKGGLITIETGLDDLSAEFVNVSIYSINGTPVSTHKVRVGKSTIQAPVKTGMYILKITSDEGAKEFKLIVK